MCKLQVELSSEALDLIPSTENNKTITCDNYIKQQENEVTNWSELLCPWKPGLI